MYCSGGGGTGSLHVYVCALFEPVLHHKKNTYGERERVADRVGMAVGVVQSVPGGVGKD